jgi:RHS repeat-associated protein
MRGVRVWKDPHIRKKREMGGAPGGEIPITNGDPNHCKFTGKERDTESGLDNFGARYFTSNLGRFMTPDWAARPTAVPYAVFGDPQSLNLYTYVENAPLNRVDADGHECTGYGLTSAASYACYAATQERGIDANETTAKEAQKAQNQREGSQANLDRRQAIADAAVETKQRADLGQKTYGPNQCSALVAGCISKAGAQVEFDDLANNGNKDKIEGWRPLGPKEKPAPGDVAAIHIRNPLPGATGDSAIVVRRGNGLSAIEAGSHGVEYNSNFVNGRYGGVVYWRYTGD